MANQTIMEYLAASSPRIDLEMENYVPRAKKPLEVYGIIWDLLDRGGKRFRPEMCLLSCEAVGGNRTLAMPAAVAIELFHNFTLIHDDIEDDSEMRRGKPCLHRLYGVPLAINAGDGLFMMVWGALTKLKSDPKRTILIQTELNRAFTHVLEGQAIELSWLRNDDWRITERDYFAMAEGKTGALISSACEVGSFIGGGSRRQQKALSDFGMAVGVAFQIQDDILNIVGEEKKYKKEIGGDITEGKRTLMTIHALKHAPAAERKKLSSILRSKTRDEKKITEAIGIILRAGSVEYAKAKAAAIVGNAKRGLSSLPKNNSSAKLLSLADFLIQREF